MLECRACVKTSFSSSSASRPFHLADQNVPRRVSKMSNHEYDDWDDSDAETIDADLPLNSNTQRFRKAIERKDILQVIYYVTFDPYLLAIDNIPSPLWLAIHKSTPEIVDVLIRNGCSIREMEAPARFYKSCDAYRYFHDVWSISDYSCYTYDTQMTLLHWAVINKSYQKVRVLIAHGASPNSTDARLNSVLQYAVESEVVAIAEELIKKGAKINEPQVKRPGNRVIHDAVNTGNIAMVKMLLSYGANANVINCIGQSLLHILLCSERQKRVAMARMLIKAGCPVDHAQKGNVTPLFMAVEQRHLHLTKLFLKCKANPSIVTAKKMFPLYLAVRSQSVDLVKLLLKYGADVNQQNVDGHTVLHVACGLGFTEIIRMLIKYRADVDITDLNGKTPLHTAIESREKSIAQILLENGADIDAKNDSNHAPLHIAAELGNYELVKLLLAYDADVHALGGNGENALHFACKSESVCLDIGQLLARAGVSVTLPDGWGYTPLHTACRNNKLELSKLFLKRGALINSKANNGDTPLHLAVSHGSTRLVAYLLSRDADVNSKGQYGETPIYGACNYHHSEKLKILLDYGADINVKNEEGTTPFHSLYYKEREAGEIMIKQMALMFDRDIKIDPMDLEAIYESGITETLYESAVIESMLMKNFKFFGKMTYYDILSMSVRELFKLVKNRNFVNAYKEHVDRYPVYGNDLKEKLNMAVMKKDFFYDAEDVLNSVFEEYLPNEVTEILASYVITDELEDAIYDESSD